MDRVYIKKEDLNSWIAKYFENQDLISFDDMISVIEDLDCLVEDLQDKLDEKENDYPNEERDREREVLGL